MLAKIDSPQYHPLARRDQFPTGTKPPAKRAAPSDPKQEWRGGAKVGKR